MNLFSKRPLLLALFIFITASAVSVKIAFLLPILCIVALVFAFTALAFTITAFLLKSRLLKRTFDTFICLFFLCLALLNSHFFFNVRLSAAEALLGEKEIVARIDSCEYSASYTSVYIARLLECDGEPADFSIELASVGPSDLKQGDIISTVAEFSPFETTTYGFNERNSMISKNVLTHAEFEEATVIGKQEHHISYFFDNVRKAISDRIGNGNKSSGLIKALLLGDKSSLESDTSLNYRRMGISHILSISGTHFTVLLGMMAIFLSNIGLGKKTVYLLLIPIAVFYMGLTGFSESVCRAGIMAIISYSAFLLGRTKDAYTALGFATFIILLASPNSVLSISLWLSVVATFTILLLNDIFSGFINKFQRLGVFGKISFAALTNLIVSVFISITTLPIVAAIFGEISIISPLANLVIIPFFSLFLYISPLCAILPSSPFSTFCDIVYACITAICSFMCSFDGLLVSLKQWFVIPVSVIFIAITVLLIAIPLKRKWVVLIPPLLCIVFLVAAVGIFSYARSDETRAVFFTEGVSDGIVLTSENETMCIDISSGASAPAYRAEYISDNAYTPEISAYLFTHYHAKHISMFAKLSSKTHIKSVYLPITDDPNLMVYMNALADAANEREIKVVWFDYGVPTVFKDCLLTVFDPIYISRSTHPVINLKISSGEKDILYLGSSFAETDFEYRQHSISAEYIIFGQHSPVPKKEFCVDTNAFTVFGSSTQASLSTDIAIDVLLEENGTYEILLQ